MSMIMRLRLRTRDVHEVQQEEAIETLQIRTQISTSSSWYRPRETSQLQSRDERWKRPIVKTVCFEVAEMPSDTINAR